MIQFLQLERALSPPLTVPPPLPRPPFTHSGTRTRTARAGGRDVTGGATGSRDGIGTGRRGGQMRRPARGRSHRRPQFDRTGPGEFLSPPAERCPPNGGGAGAQNETGV